MKRNYYPNTKNFPKRPNSKTTLEQMEKPRAVTKIRCMECGASHGTLRKVNDHGKKGYLCEYCFADYQAEEES